MEENNQENGLNQQEPQYEYVQPEANVYEEEPKAGKGMSIASLVLGILSMLCCCVPGLGLIMAVVGLILGIISIRKADGGSKGLAIAGLITSGLGILAGIYMLVSFLLGMAMVDWSRIDLNDPEATQRYLEELQRSAYNYNLFR